MWKLAAADESAVEKAGPSSRTPKFRTARVMVEFANLYSRERRSVSPNEVDPGVSTFLTGFSLSDLPRRLRRPHTWYCRRFTVNSPRLPAKLVSVRRKCPNLRHKCPNVFRAICHIFVCFHIHTGFERIFINIFFCSIPRRTFPKALIRRHIRRKSRSFIGNDPLSALIPHSPPTASRTPNPNP
jgi:hypothetical protein